MTEQPPRPSSHRAPDARSSPFARLLPSIVAVVVVGGVIAALLILNGRSTPSGPGPAVVAPPPSTLTHSASHLPSRSPSAPPASSPAPPPVSEPPATQQPAVAKVPVTVLNNSRKAGLAHQVADEVRAKGWPIASVGNFTGRVAETTVYYAPGQLAQARELASEFAQIRRIAPRFAGLPGRGLTLVVTRDWT